MLLPPPPDTHIAHRTFIARHKSKSYRIGWDSVDNRCAGRHFLQLIGLIRVSQGRVGVASSQGAHKVARDTRLTRPPPPPHAENPAAKTGNILGTAEQPLLWEQQAHLTA